MSELNKVLTATDKSTKAMATVVATLEGTLKSAQETLPALLVQIENAQSDLAQIETETKEKARLAKVELSLAVQENERKVLESLLKKFGLAEITVEAVASLHADLEAAKADNAAEVSKAVAIAKAGVESVAKAELAETVSDHKVAVAEKDADIRALRQEVSFQEKTITSLQETINAEREARVTEAQARGVSAVTVQTTAK